MSLYTLATDTLTTFADLRRQPAIDKGQVVRTLLLFIAFAIALATVAQRGHGDDGIRSGMSAATAAGIR